MKICILGNTGSSLKKVYSWFIKTAYQGLTLNGHEVIGIDFMSHSPRQIIDFMRVNKPNIVLTHTILRGKKPIDQSLSMLRDIKKLTECKIVHTMQDARTVQEYPRDISSAFDMAFVGHTVGINNMETVWKIPVKYIPYSSLVYNSLVSPVSEFSFVNPVFTGRVNIHKDRKEFIHKLTKVMKIKIIETQSKNDVRKNTLDFSNSAKCILGLCTGYNINHFVDVRPWQYLGAGAFMIIRKFKGMDDLIPPELYIPFYGYSDKDALFVKQEYNRWKDRDTTIIRQKAFNFIQKHHNCKIRTDNMLKVILGKQNTVKAFMKEI